MANDAAWQSGTDIAESSKYRRKKKSGEGKGKNSGPTSGAAMNASGNPYNILNYLPKLHKGGSVKKTGNYRLKKGEKVLTGPQQKRAGLKKGGKKKHAKKRVAGKA